MATEEGDDGEIQDVGHTGIVFISIFTVFELKI